MSSCYQCGVGYATQFVIRDGKKIKICDNCVGEFIDEGFDSRSDYDEY